MDNLLKEKLTDVSNYIIGLLKEEPAPELSAWERNLLDIIKDLQEIGTNLDLMNMDYSNKFLSDAESNIRNAILNIHKAMEA